MPDGSSAIGADRAGARQPEIGGADQAAVGEHGRAAHRRLELAHVAGPRVRVQSRERVALVPCL
jgi:hypothetical protein